MQIMMCYNHSDTINNEKMLQKYYQQLSDDIINFITYHEK